MLFASVYARLDGVCFLLAVFCGFVITMHYSKEKRKTFGLVAALAVGVTIGILLILDDGYRGHFFPPYGRIFIGFIGSMLGGVLSILRLKNAKTNKPETTTTS